MASCYAERRVLDVAVLVQQAAIGIGRRNMPCAEQIAVRSISLSTARRGTVGDYGISTCADRGETQRAPGTISAHVQIALTFLTGPVAISASEWRSLERGPGHVRRVWHVAPRKSGSYDSVHAVHTVASRRRSRPCL